uniref:Uncharacterized protein n=1 Tax=Arcella intermedia TaxID=1963864 RepID=A0A6B2LK36_9EUKA|eukprot:TRINITY_DN13066_c0_g1_i1.p1 TRINITY_DN13066_c0_g1~~TRINITY_DN13066_c0_g1_i1.p1  ORF type:complete len:190 (+),score=57.59 TRINITY_DN13066_c0_g1_i1:94-663(+)
MDSIKVIVLGCAGVGKSAITISYIQGIFVEDYDPNIEDSYRKQVQLDGAQYMIDVLDTAGTEQFSPLRDTYLNTCEGFILVYSILAQSTFLDLPSLKEYISKVKGTQQLPLVLVGNKADLSEQRMVTTEQGEALAMKLKAKFFEASAKSKLNVNETFETLLRWIVKDSGREEARKKRTKCPKYKPCQHL